MTTFRQLLGDMIREYFSTPNSPEATQMAREWQRTYTLPHDLRVLPGYQPGQYARNYHRQLESAVQAATSPRQATEPIVMRDNTPPVDVVPLALAIQRDGIANVSTSKLNPVTPLPETRAELFNDVPSLEESLILFPLEDDEDDDPTEIRERKQTAPRIPTSTQKIPTLNAERILVEMTRGPVHPQGTGEFEPVREKHWML